MEKILKPIFDQLSIPVSNSYMVLGYRSHMNFTRELVSSIVESIDDTDTTIVYYDTECKFGCRGLKKDNVILVNMGICAGVYSSILDFITNIVANKKLIIIIDSLSGIRVPDNCLSTATSLNIRRVNEIAHLCSAITRLIENHDNVTLITTARIERSEHQSHRQCSSAVGTGIFVRGEDLNIGIGPIRSIKTIISVNEDFSIKLLKSQASQEKIIKLGGGLCIS